MAKESSRSPLPPWALPVALAILVIGSIAAVGSVTVGAIVVFAGVAVAVGGLALLEVRARNRVPSSKPLLVLVGLGVFCALQALPLPISWLQAISPTAADIWSRSLLPIGETVSAGSVSLSPGASLIEAVKWLSYALTFFAAGHLARTRSSGIAVAFVAASGLFVAISAIAHELLGATTLFGIYQPRSTPARFVAPLLNANNLAGYLVLATLATLGLMFAKRIVLPRWLLGSSVVVMVLTIFRSGSRGGVLALLLGLAMFAALLSLRWFSERRERDRLPMLAVSGVVGLSVVVGIAFVFLDAEQRLFRELVNENTQKIQLVSWSQPLIRDFAWTGLGRGGFESVFSAYRPAIGQNTTFTHPENFVVQWVSEWGLLAGGAALATLAWWFRPWRIGLLKSNLAGAVASGLVALLLQNLVDLGLEVFGVGLSVATLLGTLWGQSRRSPGGSARASLIIVPLVAVSTLVLAGFALARGTRLLELDRDEALASFRAQSSTPTERAKEDFNRRLVELMKEHPADYYFPLLGAAAATDDPAGQPIPWIQRALERGPTIGRPHLILAEVLHRKGAVNQALLELRLAMELEPSLLLVAAPMALRFAHTPAQLERAVPDGPVGGDFLDLVAMQSSQRDLAWKEAVDTLALDLKPELRGPRQRLIARRVDALTTGEPPCKDAELCRIEVDEHADFFSFSLPRSTFSAQARGRLALALGRPADAAEELRAGCDGPEEREACLQLLLQALARLPDTESEISAITEQYLRAACVDRTDCAAAHTWSAQFRAGRGEWASAMNHQERACTEEPSKSCWLDLAQAAERAGAFNRAAEALEKAQRLQHGDTALMGRIEENRRRALQRQP